MVRSNVTKNRPYVSLCLPAERIAFSALFYGWMRGQWSGCIRVVPEVIYVGQGDQEKEETHRNAEVQKAAALDVDLEVLWILLIFGQEGVRIEGRCRREWSLQAGCTGRSRRSRERCGGDRSGRLLYRGCGYRAGRRCRFRGGRDLAIEPGEVFLDEATLLKELRKTVRHGLGKWSQGVPNEDPTFNFPLSSAERRKPSEKDGRSLAGTAQQPRRKKNAAGKGCVFEERERKAS